MAVGLKEQRELLHAGIATAVPQLREGEQSYAVLELGLIIASESLSFVRNLFLTRTTTSGDVSVLLKSRSRGERESAVLAEEPRCSRLSVSQHLTRSAFPPNTTR